MPNVVMIWEQGHAKYGSEFLKRLMKERYNVYVGLRMTAHEKAQQLIDTLNDANNALGVSDAEERRSDNVKELIKCLQRI